MSTQLFPPILFFLLVSLLLPSPSQAGPRNRPRTLVRGETKRVKDEFDALFQAQDSFQEIQKDLSAPKQVCLPPLPPKYPQNSPQNLPQNPKDTFRDQVLETLQELEKQMGESIPFSEVYHLVEFIDSHIQEWRKQPRTLPIQYLFKLNPEDSDPIEVPIEIDFDGNLNVVFSFPSNRLGSGAFKAVDKVFSYKTWERLARAIPLNEELAKDPSFQAEVAMLHKVAKIPPKKRKGIVDIVSIKDQAIYQKMYDINLYKATRSQLRKLTDDEKIESIRQLSHGLNTLVQHGIIHGDIKTDNAVLDYAKPANRNQLKLAWIDYGLSYDVKSHLRSGPVLNHGSPGYMAPELYEGGSEDFKELNLKNLENPMDRLVAPQVYSFAQTAYEIFHGTYHPCSEVTAMKPDLVIQFKALGKLKECLSDAWKNEVHQTAFQPLNLVALEGMHFDPKKRITLQAFSDAMDLLPSTPASHSGEAGYPKEQIVDALKDFPGYIPHTDLKELDQQLSSQPEGTYAFFPFPHASGSGFKVGVAWQTQGYGVIKKFLDFDPSHKDGIEKTFKFLKTLGSLKKPLKKN